MNKHCLKLVLQYDGTAFHGWQKQPSQRTVQGELESALFHLTGEACSVIGSGRTDKGVHATGQVASLLIETTWTAGKLLRALNALLPNDIWISSSAIVNSDFHPRFDAISRTYFYNLGLSDESSSPFNYKWCWPLRAELDRSLLNRATKLVIGEHSFKSFAKSGQPHRGYICLIQGARWLPWKKLGLSLQITGNRFLHHMVRYLVGTLVDIAIRKRPSEDLRILLSNSDAKMTTSPPAPPTGLFLTDVAYPQQNEIY